MKPKIYPPYLTDTNVFDYWETWPSGFFCQRNHIDLQNHTKISKEILCFISILWLFFSLIRIRQFSSFQPGVGKRTGFSPIFGLGLKIDGRTRARSLRAGSLQNRAKPGWARPDRAGHGLDFFSPIGLTLKGPRVRDENKRAGPPFADPCFQHLIRLVKILLNVLNEICFYQRFLNISWNFGYREFCYWL